MMGDKSDLGYSTSKRTNWLLIILQIQIADGTVNERRTMDNYGNTLSGGPRYV